jgi:hypothetical protein
LTDTRANPNLPATHPQNVPLSKWTDGWLTMEVGGILQDQGKHGYYLMLYDHEKAAAGLPVTREEMIDYIVNNNGMIPAAGI